MKKAPQPKVSPDRRAYVRMDSVFPVQFQLLDADGRVVSRWVQGFTSNVCKAGLCLEVNNLEAGALKALEQELPLLSLEIEMPIKGHPVKANARIAWIRPHPRYPRKHLIGLSYEGINPVHSARIVRFALLKKFFGPTTLVLALVFAAAFGLNTYANVRLVQGNRALVRQLVGILQESTLAQQKIREISRDKDEMQLRLQTLQLQIQSLEEEKEKRKEEANRIEQLNEQIQKLNQDKAVLQEGLISLQHRESAVTDQLLDLRARRTTLEKANFDKMYQWLKAHQNPRTGLVMSFEGDGGLAQWAFIYDQSLVAQVYVNFAEYDRAKKIFSFLEKKAKRQDGLFLNAYYANDGSPAEFSVHCGPNIWLGIALLHYTSKTQDRTYVKLAEELAEGILRLQAQDASGGIRGGPGVEWYSTEHNLDAYAFFQMLYTIVGKEKYAQARDRVFAWLVANTYDKQDVPIKRGKGDATIATDTYAWSIAAVGPEKLEEAGMNPDRIVEFAQEHCAVEVPYVRPDGTTVTVRGFDFAPERHVARGGVVSSEWTAQMIISFRIMATYHEKKGLTTKSLAYTRLADDYLDSLSGMIISSPSPSGQGESCLPYATQENVDTGHGWMTPKGNATGSVAGTAYTLFAYYNYNPLELKQ